MIYRLTSEDVKARAITAIVQAPSDGQRVIEVIIQPEDKRRSARQNRYYWAIVNCISAYVGESSEYLHEEFKERYLPGVEVANKKNTKTFVIHSTKGLNTTEFADYTEKCRAVGLRLGLNIPLPDDERQEQFMKEYGYVSRSEKQKTA